MSIKLDWEVESEGGWAEIGEDAAALAARKRQAQRARTIITIILVSGLVIGGVIGFRLYTADQQARADLSSTVTAETAAIRIGDTGAYLDIQQNVGSWRQMQQDRFGQYQDQIARVKTEGEIVTLDTDSGKGRVVIRELVDDKPYNVIWFYQHGDDGWKHVPPEIAFWGFPHEITTSHYNINYWDEDAEFVKKLQDRLERWWDTACRLTACLEGSLSMPPLMKVRIEPDPLLELGWAPYDPNTLRIPSPMLGRVPADGEMDPQLERTLALYVANHWARQAVGAPPGDISDLAWAQDELQTWLVSSFISGAPPAPLFGPLAQNTSDSAVMALIDRVKQNQDAAAAMQDVTGKSIGELPVLWDRYLTYRLRSEASLVAGDHATEAMLLYRDPERTNDANVVDVWLGLMHATPGTIEVTSTRQVGELLWAEVHFRRASPAGENGTVRIDSVMTYEPFRVVNGRWVHTVALDSDFGDPAAERGQHIVLHYQTIDVPTVDGLLSDLEQQYMTIVTDLGITELPPMDIHISTQITGEGFALSPPSGYPEEAPDGIAMWIGSPYSAIYLENESQRVELRELLTRDMAIHLTEFRARPLNSSNALVGAITRWEVNHLGLTGSAAVPRTALQGAPAPQVLDALWIDSLDVNRNGEKEIAADVLIAIIVEQRGPEAIPALLGNLAGATGMEDWLSRSVDLHALDLEPGWKLRMRAELPGSIP